jgi:hypothetical protein
MNDLSAKSKECHIDQGTHNEGRLEPYVVQDRLDKTDILKTQLNMYMDLYKHHYELYIKGMVIWLAVIGALAGYIFRPDIDMSTKCALSVFISVCSINAFFGGVLSKRWVNRTEEALAEIWAGLGIKPYRFTHVKGIILIMQIASGLLFLGGLFYFFFLLSRM